MDADLDETTPDAQGMAAQSATLRSSGFIPLSQNRALGHPTLGDNVDAAGTADLMSKKILQQWSGLLSRHSRRERETLRRKAHEASHAELMDRMLLRLPAASRGGHEVRIVRRLSRRPSTVSVSSNHEYRRFAPSVVRRVVKTVLRERRSSDGSSQSELSEHSDVSLRSGGASSSVVRSITRAVYIAAIGDDRVRGRHSLVIYHRSPLRRAIDVAVVICTVGALCLLPLEPLLSASVPVSITPSALPSSWLSLAFGIARVVFMVDVAASTITTYSNSAADVIVTSVRHLAFRYARTWLLVDCAAAFPIEWLVSSTTVGPLLARLPLLCKLLKLQTIRRRLQHEHFRTSWSAPTQIVFRLVAFLLIIHLFACSWASVLLSYHAGGYIAPWAVMHNASRLESTATVYTYAVSDVIAMLAGSTIASESNLLGSRVFAAVCKMLGLLAIPLLAAEFMHIYSQLYASSREYSLHMGTIADSLRKHRLPTELSTRVLQYMHYLWVAHGTFSLQDQMVHKGLSPTLTSEVAIFVHHDLVTKVPFFACCSPAVVQSVVQCIVPEVRPTDLLLLTSDL